VNGVSFSVAEGEFFGFLGPNGAGKSTTIKILSTLLAPSSGSARVAGRDVLEEPAAVRRALGVLFQDPAVDDRLTEGTRPPFASARAPSGSRSPRRTTRARQRSSAPASASKRS